MCLRKNWNGKYPARMASFQCHPLFFPMSLIHPFFNAKKICYFFNANFFFHQSIHFFQCQLAEKIQIHSKNSIRYHFGTKWLIRSHVKSHSEFKIQKNSLISKKRALEWPVTNAVDSDFLNLIWFKTSGGV